jgi:hypothetical protein
VHADTVTLVSHSLLLSPPPGPWVFPQPPGRRQPKPPHEPSGQLGMQPVTPQPPPQPKMLHPPPQLNMPHLLPLSLPPPPSLPLPPGQPKVRQSRVPRSSDPEPESESEPEELVGKVPVFVLLGFVVLVDLRVRGPPATGGLGYSTENVGWGWIVTATDVGKKVTRGMMAKGTSRSEDVATTLFVVIGTPFSVDIAGLEIAGWDAAGMDAAGVGVAAGKVAWFGGSVQRKEGGVMLYIGLMVYWSGRATRSPCGRQ